MTTPTTPPPGKRKRAAKSPPPPGPVPLAKPTRTPMSAASTPEPTVIVSKSSRHQDALRAQARVEYATDSDQCSLVVLNSRPAYAHLHRRTLEVWCVEDKWVEERERFIRTWQTKIEGRMANALVRIKLNHMEELENIGNVMIGKLKADMLQANSWEGAVTALLKLMDKMDDFREEITTHLAPQIIQATPSGGQSSSPGVPAVARPVLTNDEARAAALTVVRMRRENMRQQMALQEQLAANPEKGEKSGSGGA